MSKAKRKESFTMDLYIELHTVQNTLAEGRMEMTHSCEGFKEIVKKLKSILNCNRENEFF